MSGGREIGMSTKKRAAGAVAAVIAAGVCVATTPGQALAQGTGAAIYNCSYNNPFDGSLVTANGVNSTWQHGASDSLKINTDLVLLWPVSTGYLSTVVNGVTVPNVTRLDDGRVVLGPTTVPGAVTAPSVLTMQFAGPPAYTVTCSLTSSSGFPI